MYQKFACSDFIDAGGLLLNTTSCRFGGPRPLPRAKVFCSSGSGERAQIREFRFFLKPAAEAVFARSNDDQSTPINLKSVILSAAEAIFKTVSKGKFLSGLGNTQRCHVAVCRERAVYQVTERKSLRFVFYRCEFCWYFATYHSYVYLWLRYHSVNEQYLPDTYLVL